MSLSAILCFTLFLTTVIARGLPNLHSNNIVSSQFPMSLTPVLDNQVRVPIILGVMSRCPDALLCESLFDKVLKYTWNIVDISLAFVGKINGSDPEFGVTCMHGVQECRGDVQELCAMKIANTQQDWWNFVQCLNFEGKEDVGNPELAERCAGLAYIPWNDKAGDTTRRGIRSCAYSLEGRELLQASVEQSQRLGIEKSCTIMISGKTRCIHDGTWKECETGHSVEELVAYIQDEYQRLNPQETSPEDE